MIERLRENLESIKKFHHQSQIFHRRVRVLQDPAFVEILRSNRGPLKKQK